MSTQQVDSSVAMGALSNLKNFRADQKLKQATFAFIASQLLTKNEKENLAKIFKAIDKNGDGKLSKEEILEGYDKFFGKTMEKEDVLRMFDAVSSTPVTDPAAGSPSLPNTVPRRFSRRIDARPSTTMPVMRTTPERFGAASLVKSLAPALDAMDAAAEHATADAEGIRLTRSTLLAALHDHGVEPLAPRVGDAFDPQTMEAMFTVPVADGAPTGKVEKVIRPGYVIHRERLVRASQVGVGAKASAGA
jgi:hypothetical protein